MKAVILAGGRGTRIASVNAEVPKPMIPILGKPILQHQIEVLRAQGYTDLILVIGYLGRKIRDYFGDGAAFGVRIRYFAEETPLGTAGALAYLKDELTEDFLLLCGDLLFDVDLHRFARAHRENGGLATLFTHPNSHPQDSAVLVSDERGRVIRWLNREDERLWFRNRVNAGLHLLSPRILRFLPNSQKADLDRDLLKPLVGTGELYVYDSPEYVKDMGTPDRFRSVSEDLASGLVWAKNLSRRQKAIFLDRDGTVNRYVGFLTHIDQFELLDGVAAAIRRINESGYLAVLATNQPVVARGEVSPDELAEIHKKMETLLGREGAYLDAVYVCPHHPDKGYPGERAEFKIECTCRKPKPGMLLAAAEAFNIDLSASWMVGDGKHDVLAGIAAGCRTALIGDGGEDYGQTVTVGSLSDFVDRLFAPDGKGGIS